MEMIRKSFKKALQKGEIGEDIVRQCLEKKGWIVYQPKTDGAHCFDMLSIKDKKTAIALDIKAKARMNKYPATGIDQKQYEEYAFFSKKHNMPFWVIFVDEMLGKIYGNTIEELESPRIAENKAYPFVFTNGYGQKIRLWPLSAMIPIASIVAEDIHRLKSLNQRNYSFQKKH